MNENILINFEIVNSTYDQVQINNKKNIAASYLQNGIEVEGRYNLYPERAAAVQDL